MTDTKPQKPQILYAVPPREGHMSPALQISAHLTSQGFSITIPSTSSYKSAIESIGATYSPMIGRWKTLHDASKWPRIAYATSVEARLKASLHDGFVTLLPSGLESIRIALADMRRKMPGRKIVGLSDTCFSGTLPLKLGVDLPFGFDGEEEIKTLGIGVVPVYYADPLRPPWGSGLSFDETEAGKARNLAAYSKAFDRDAEDEGRRVLDILGCTKSLDELYAVKGPDYGCSEMGLQRPFCDAATVCHDVTLQMGLPSIEYPATEWPKRVKFAGVLPVKALPSDLVYASWFDELRANGRRREDSSETSTSASTRKKVILVAQGTEVLDYTLLLIPTILAFAHHPNILIIAILCSRGATLHPDQFPSKTIPSNVRIIDYFPYDAILPYADVFVSNSGYGGLTHAIANGVPLVQAGRDFDKPDIGRRVEWSGLGVYLDVGMVSSEVLRAAVEEVLGERRYWDRAGELMREGRACRPLDMIVDEILELVD